MSEEGFKFFKSTKGSDKLFYNGYFYTKNRGDLPEPVYWRCDVGRKPNPVTGKQQTTCSGSAKTEIIDGQTIVYEMGRHNCERRAMKWELIEASNKAKELAKAKLKPSQVIQEVTASTSADVTGHLPSKNAMRLVVKRIQRKAMVKEPKSLEEINIPEDHKLTIDGNQFLAKEIRNGQDVAILFLSKDSLRFLLEAEYWICDGTFKTVPTILYQLYTIHGLVARGDNRHVFPLAYCIMSGKSEELYRIVFEEIQRIADGSDARIETKLAIADFERAPMNAIKEIFPEFEVNGCFFHFKQCLMKKLSEGGFKVRYCTDIQFWLEINKIAALAFLPPDEIVNGFESLQPFMSAELDDFYKYVDKTWIRGELRSVSRSGTERRSPVLYSPRIWSVNNRTELGIPRTQNIVESWHNRISTIIGRDHVGLYSLIGELKKEEHAVHGNIRKLLNGTKLTFCPPALKEREDRIKTILKNRSSYPVSEFLEALASNLSL